MCQYFDGPSDKVNIFNIVIIKWKYKNVYLYLLSNKTAMISRNLDHQQKTYTHALFLQVSEWVSVVV